MKSTDWLSSHVSEGWSELSELLDPPQAQFAFRGDHYPVVFGQPIDFGMQLGERELALVVAVAKENESCLDLKIQLHSLNHQLLPENLQLSIQDSSNDEIILSTTARQQDNILQLNLEAESGDRFRTIVSFQSEEFVQEFLV